MPYHPTGRTVMRFGYFIMALAFFLLSGPSHGFENRPVKAEIAGYDGDIMEPFLSRDGRFLFFNDEAKEVPEKDIFWAVRRDDFHFDFKGRLKGVNSGKVDGVPTMDDHMNFYFVSAVGYSFEDLATVFQGTFDPETGSVKDIRPLPELALGKPGWLNMDIEVSPDGGTLYFTQTDFTRQPVPRRSYFAVAHRKKDGHFAIDPQSPKIFSHINKDKIVYAATASRDGRTLYYTRLKEPRGLRPPAFTMFRVERRGADASFGKPVPVTGLEGFIEAPAFSHDEKLLYFHMKPAPGEHFGLYAIRIK